MNMPTTEQHEMQLQETLNQWQNQQRVHGNVLLFLCIASFVSFALFCLDPCPGTTWLLVVSLMLMVYAGASMFRAAHAVVQHKELLQAAAISSSDPETCALPAAAFYGKGGAASAAIFEPAKPWIFPGRQN
jgi:protein-S-isoprenylcysteine O-methyltransferase Ste14